LRFTNHACNSFEDLIEAEITPDLIGLFGDYLFKKVAMIKKYNFAKMYLSAIYCQMCEKFPERKTLLERRYSNACKSMKDDFLAKALSAGKQLEDNAVVGKISDFIYMATKLFRESTQRSMYLRCLVVLDFQGVGRITEVTSLINLLLLVLTTNNYTAGSKSLPL
jgi:hypothetical protein